MEEARDFQDWEMLQTSEVGFVRSPNSVETTTRGFVGIEADSEGVIRSDYITLDSDKRYTMTVAKGDLSEEISVDWDNPTRVDPDSELKFGDESSREVGLQGINLGRENDSGSDHSISKKFIEFEGKADLGLEFYAKNEVSFEGFKKKEKEENSGDFLSDSSVDNSIPEKFEDDFDNYENTSDEPKISSEAKGVIELESNGIIINEFDSEGDETSEEMENFSTKEVTPGEEGKVKMVWWKFPLELLKFYVFRAKPVWSFTIAAVAMGFIILGRRLYNMRRKTRSIRLNVTVDDKKVSQFMIRAARLNEAFSVVRRFPTIRPSLPVSGVTPWPVMSLR